MDDGFVFGTVLREARLRAGMTQTQLGNKCGIIPNKISNWELGGNGHPYMADLRRLCKGLGVSADELLGLEHLRLNQHELDCLNAYRKAPEPIRLAIDALLNVVDTGK